MVRGYGQGDEGYGDPIKGIGPCCGNKLRFQSVCLSGTNGLTHPVQKIASRCVGFSIDELQASDWRRSSKTRMSHSNCRALGSETCSADRCAGMVPFRRVGALSARILAASSPCFAPNRSSPSITCVRSLLSVSNRPAKTAINLFALFAPWVRANSSIRRSASLSCVRRAASRTTSVATAESFCQGTLSMGGPDQTAATEIRSTNICRQGQSWFW